jgi:hypothetical protein
MTSAELLIDAFDRVRQAVHHVVDGVSDDQLVYRVTESANSIAWLVWHLTRIQDDHVADAAGIPQVWTAHGWATRFALPFDDTDTGYGHTAGQVAAVRTGGELLVAYHDAVYRQTIDHVAKLLDDDLPRIVDRSWDPPVTLGVRLVSVIADDLEHVGQAAFIRGLLL